MSWQLTSLTVKEKIYHNTSLTHEHSATARNPFEVFSDTISFPVVHPSVFRHQFPQLLIKLPRLAEFVHQHYRVLLVLPSPNLSLSSHDWLSLFTAHTIRIQALLYFCLAFVSRHYCLEHMPYCQDMLPSCLCHQVLVRMPTHTIRAQVSKLGL